ncbi:hypothetical protein CLJU_c13590 [Clostridium ljungdahlii DSM 13528]|uniref:Uncharacterized protein n=1 Tax=Clostridium ljungdahlii (strain ATCC 55383 / DSM 13528 / PETC) TaxID=748727 RepID=D8GS74_CLOLD|nr:hypothetical protein CLJU_c13590 [Clostridium ljungdahlii DSM 13528]
MLIPHFEEDGGVSNGSNRIKIPGDSIKLPGIFIFISHKVFL